MKWALLLAAILLNAAANLFLKLGMNRAGEISLQLSVMAKLITSPFIIAGITSFAVSLVAYSLTLQRFELSVAYPLMTTTGFVILSICSVIWLKESFSVVKVIGMILVLIGVFMIAHESK